MSRSTDTVPAYRVSRDGSIELNEAGQVLRAQNKALQAKVDALDHEYGDAVIACLFHRHRWAEALTVSVSAAWEYDDSGGYYLSGSCQVTSVTITNAPWPEEIVDKGVADHDLAASMLTDALDDDAPDLALMLLGDGQPGEQNFTFAAEPLLAKFGLTDGGDVAEGATTPTDLA